MTEHQTLKHNNILNTITLGAFGKEKRNGVDENKKIKNKWKIKLFDWREIEKKNKKNREMTEMSPTNFKSYFPP